MAGSLRDFINIFRGRDASSRIQDAAWRRAMGAASDAEARDELAADLSEIPLTALISEIAAWHPRQDYLGDRAYRLLLGVRDGGEVPPIQAELRERFSREESLGRLPLDEAFARIAASIPALLDLAQRARHGQRFRTKEFREISKLLDGRPAASTEFWVVAHHLRDCERGRITSTPLFDRDSLFHRHSTITVRSGT